MAGSLAASVATGAAASILWLRTSLPPTAEEVTVNGVAAPVEVLRDRHWVPHVFAQSLEDATYALGYVHAQDRLWQMESMRRLGAGRLAEIVGESALSSDRFMRTVGVYRLAEAQYHLLSEEAKRTVDAYVAGVNAWIKHRDGALPPEFIALGVKPEPWRAADSLVWSRIMAMRLAGNRRAELLRARLQGRLSNQQIAELTPPHPADEPVTVQALDVTHLGLPADWPTIPEPAALETIAGASNVWAVAGSHTASGKPLLANDPHLGFAAPIHWYLVRIATPEADLVGATIPGFPFLVLGHNGRIAWGMSNTGSDVVDLFVERIDPTDPGRYLAPDGPLPFTVRSDVIKVDGRDEVVLDVRETRHGPIISEVTGSLPAEVVIDGEGVETIGAETVIALAATYLRDDDRTAEAAYRLNRARDWGEFIAATEHFHSPQSNLMYADVDGNIGFIAPGRVPIRRSGQGTMPTAGWTGETDWTGFVPFEDLPRDFNPGSGRLVNANNRIVPDAYPWYLGAEWDEGYRAQRIDDLLVADARHTPQSMAAVQMDIVSLMARDLLPRMLRTLPERDRHRPVTAMLRAWSGEMSRARPEPLIFAAWMRAFNEAVYADELGDLTRSFLGYRPRFISFVLEQRPIWCDDVTTRMVETCADRLETALDAALESHTRQFGQDASAWRWGDVHRARFDHRTLGSLPVIGAFTNLSIGTDGGFYTVNRGANRLGEPDDPFAHVHGAGFRAVYDLADLSKSDFVIATGQSGNPLSPHYRDLLRIWRDGGWIRLDQSRESLGREARGRLTLVPQ